MPRFLAIICLLWAVTAHAREWRSTEGGRTLQGEFVRLNGNQLVLRTDKTRDVAIDLDALSIEDKAFARAAHVAATEAAKLGPRGFEITQTLKSGWICRMAQKMASGSVLYTGEMFFVITDQVQAQGSRLKDKTLYPAGQRTFHPTQGTEGPIRAFTLTLDAAVEDSLAIAAGTTISDVYEPIVHVEEVIGLGFAVAENGLVLVDAAMLEGAKDISIDLGKTYEPGRVVTTDPSLGFAVVSCKAELSPARLAPRKPIALGQPIYAVGVGLSKTKKSVADPSITKGIISKLTSPTGKDQFFQHDASLDADALGGVVLAEKGDVLGVFVPRSLIKVTKTTTTVSAPPLGVCLRSEVLMAFLRTLPKAEAARPAATSADLQHSLDVIKKAVVIVKVTRETKEEVTPGKAGATGGYSLSKSGLRHNAKCRYFDSGKPCGSADGKACKTCGG